MVRITYRGNWRVPYTTESFVAKALTDLGHDVVRCQEDRLDWDVVRAEALRSDLFLWQRTWGIDNPGALATLAALRSAAIPSASYHLDLYHGLERETQLLDDPFWRTDWVFTADGGHDADFAAMGIRHHWLPPAVDPSAAVPTPTSRRFPHPVVFVGSHPYPHPAWEPHRSAMLLAVAHHFGRDFRIWPDHGRPLRLRHLSSLYRSAKVVIGDSCLAGRVERYWSDRIPETLARGGGVLIHPEVPGMEDWYRDGQDLLTYPAGDHAALIGLVERLLADDDERAAIAAQGQATVLGRDLYTHRMAEMLTVIAEGARAPAPAPAPVRLAPSTKLACGDCEHIASMTCGACGGGDLASVVCLGDLPLANGLLDDPATPGPRYPLHVLACPRCLAVQLSRQVAPETMFVRYPYFSSQSATMVDSAGALVDWTVATRGLGLDDLVLEIGSNDGYLLRHYVERGVGTVGVDPAEAPAEVARSVGVGTEVAFFDSTLAERYRHQAAVVHANNVLAHVPDPGAVLAAAHRVLRPDGVLIVETPWLAQLVTEAQFDTVYHEHRYMWSLHALGALLACSGFTVSDVEHLDIHGGSLRIFATPRPTLPARSVARVMAEERSLGLDSLAGLDGFAQRVRARMETLRPWLASLGPGVAGYGAAAKGVMMLNAIGAVDFVVDSTPAKQGRWLPGVAVPVLAPEALEERMPADCVLLAWNFEAELLAKLAGYVARGGRVWTTTPEPRLVSAGVEAHAVPA